MVDVTSGSSNGLPDVTLGRLRELRAELLHLHKSLLELQRSDFERLFGRVTSGELFQLVISHADFAWLRPISALVVEIDEMLDADEPPTVIEMQNLLAQARLLVALPADNLFRKKYQEALQREPAVVMAHSNLVKILGRKNGRETPP